MPNPRFKTPTPVARSVGLLMGAMILMTPFLPLSAGAPAAVSVEVTPAQDNPLSREGPLPVTVLERDAILDSGAANIPELLRALPVNSQGSLQPLSGDSSQSIAAVDLRGLGPARTLVMMDGRRLAVAPEGLPTNNLKQIPLSRVERIEILPAGASAVYGSDSIGGVVHILTRSGFTGVETTAGVSFPEKDGGRHREAAVLMGQESAQGQIMAGADFRRRDIIMQRDRGANPGASPFANNFYRDADRSQPLEHPEWGAVVPGAGCGGENFFTMGEGASTRCFYDFRPDQAAEAESETYAFFARGKYQLTGTWDLEFNAGTDRLQSYGQNAPAPSSPWPGGAPALPPGSPNHPTTPPGLGGLNPDYDDPYYQQYADEELHVAHRFAAAGPRETSTDAHIEDLGIRATGELDDWDLEVGVRHNEYRSIAFADNLLVGDAAQDRINRGTYNLYDPQGISRENLNTFRHRASQDSRFIQREADLIAWTDPAQLPAGPIAMVTGVQYRREDFYSEHDPLTAGGRIVGRGGTSAGTDREAGAAFLEGELPITEQLNLRLATRYDRYSDFGDRVSPMIATRYQPTERVVLRASWGEGFRAPDLASLSPEPSPGTLQVIDPATAGEKSPQRPSSVPGTIVSQPGLSAETSRHFGLGAAIHIPDGFHASVDYYHVQVDDLINNVDLQTIRDCLAGETRPCPENLGEWDAAEVHQMPDPSRGLGLVRDNATGAITYAQSGPANFGETRTRGLDLELSLDYTLGNIGSLEHHAMWTWVKSFRVDGEERRGNNGYPEHRGQLRHILHSGNYRFAWFTHYIDAQSTHQFSANSDSVESWMRHDIQVQWQSPWDARVSLGIRNFLNQHPPDGSLGGPFGFNTELYDRYGREPYLRYTQSF